LTASERSAIDARLDELLRPQWWEYEEIVRNLRADIEFLIDYLNDTRYVKRALPIRRRIAVECDGPRCAAVVKVNAEYVAQELLSLGWSRQDERDFCPVCQLNFSNPEGV